VTLSQDLILEVERLVLRHPDVLALDRVDLTLRREAIVALLGPSGCGKTSLLRAIAGFETPESGSIQISGRLVCGGSHWVRAEHRNVGMVFQEGALFPHLSVWENVLYGVRGRPGAEDRAREVIDLVGIGSLVDRFPGEISGGQQQRAGLARALAPSPSLVLLDEPFANLDAGLRANLRSEMREILHRAKMSAILVTHDQEEALSFADEVAVMDRGRILQVGVPRDVYQRPVDVTVARFFGTGQLVECAVQEGQFECAFGVGPCDAPDGDGFVFLRPEDLGVLPGAREGAAGGTVVDRRFFGHDVLDVVRLDAGETIEVRVLSPTTVPIGSKVQLTLRPRQFEIYATREG